MCMGVGDSWYIVRGICVEMCLQLLSSKPMFLISRGHLNLSFSAVKADLS